MGRISAYRVLSSIEAWLKGYKSEHLQLGLQQGICQALALLPLLINSLFRAINRGGSALFIAVTVAVVLEPSTGDSFRKLALRLAGAGVSGGISILLLFFAVGIHEYSYEEYQHELAAWIVPGIAICSFVYTTNQHRFWHMREFWMAALLTMPIIVVPAIRSTNEYFYTGACYRMMDVVLGIMLAAVVSLFVFPVRAWHMLERKMSSTLIKMGDLAVWLLGQVCVPPVPGTGAMPAKSGTDNLFLYTDDGLRMRLQPLMTTINRLADDVSYMWKLLASANAEFAVLPPHRFPTQQYKWARQNLLHSCHISLGIFYTLLNSMQCGDISLQICQQHIGNLSEAGVRLSVAFTALGSLIRPPKVKKKRKEGKKPNEAAEGVGAVAAVQGTGASAAQQLPPQQQHRHHRQKQEQHEKQYSSMLDVEHAAGEAAGSEDDPFAGFDDEMPGAGPSPVVNLSDSQVMSAQQMARHLSQGLHEHGSGSRPGDREGSRSGGLVKLACLAEGSTSEVFTPYNLAAGISNGFAAVAARAPGRNASMSIGSLQGSNLSGERRREWTLCKLQALVDAVETLEGSSCQERSAHFNAATEGLPSFMFVVHALINLTRQCGACFTALDEERGAALHSYFQAARLQTKTAVCL